MVKLMGVVSYSPPASAQIASITLHVFHFILNSNNVSELSAQNNKERYRRAKG